MNLKVSFPEGLKVNAEYNGFVHKTDQPVAGGGDGSAPSPFDMFLASIGTCAGIYILGFCKQRGIDASEVEIHQSMEFDPIKRMISKINLEIRVPDSFPEKYKAALINSANLCAVKKHLENPPEFHVYTN